MKKTPDYTIHRGKSHFGWDRSIPPVLTAAPGDIVEFEAKDASGDQIFRDSTIEDVSELDFSKVNPVTGPVKVDGAEPGDVLRITVVSFDLSGWGWTAVIPGFGLLADKFTEPALHIWNYDPSGEKPAIFGPGGKVPIRPFPGTIGVATREEGPQSIVNPRRVGGNMDARDIVEGTVLYLPVEVPGALLSVGDGHAAQGDGEVCGTAIESPMKVVLKLDIEKNMDLKFPRFTTPGPVTRHIDASGYEVTTGIGPDLMEAAKVAVDSMVELISQRRGMSLADAYMLCSVCADLRISEIVDAPDWIVSFYFPLFVFE